MNSACDSAPQAEGVARRLLARPILVAVLVAVLFGLPHLLIPLVQRERGYLEPYVNLVAAGVTSFGFDECNTYGAFVRREMDGFFRCADPYVYEHRDVPRMFGWLPNAMLGQAARLLGSVERLAIAGDFVFPAIFYLILYRVLRRWGCRPDVATLGALGVLLGQPLLAYLPPRGFSQLGELWTNLTSYGGGHRPLDYSRFYVPSFIVLFFAWSLGAVHAWLEDGERRARRLWAAAGSMAVLFYLYVYYWTFLCAGTAIYVAARWGSDPQGRRALLVRAFQLAALTALLSVPFWYDFVSSWTAPYAADLKMRLVQTDGRFTGLAKGLKYLAVAAVLFALSARRAVDLWAASLIAGGAACLNAQLLTGHTVQPWHWETRAVHPAMALSLALALQNLMAAPRWWGRLARSRAVGFVGLFLLAWGFSVHLTYSTSMAAAHRLPAPQGACLDWLGSNTCAGDVVLTNSIEFNALLTAHTHCFRFVPGAISTLVPTDEGLERMFLGHRLLDVPAEVVRGRLSSEARIPPGVNAGAYCPSPEQLEEMGRYFFLGWRYARSESETTLPASVAAQFEARYRALPAKPAQWLDRFKLDWIVLTPADRRLGTLRPERFGGRLQLAKEFPGYQVFRVLSGPAARAQR
ncbi:MAG: hypothetical protein HY814_11490 [Candidatus Riflebacteria bacterium]|nr:hypothetical protein [Candidatus Riflebacteria bacterium]